MAICCGAKGDILWPLTDNLGTVRDLAEYDAATDTTTIADHFVWDSFGNETSGTFDFLFGFTGRAFDHETGLQNNWERWYDAPIGRWLSEDPIGFAAGDANVYRYVGNFATGATDPSGLANLWNPLTWGVESAANQGWGDFLNPFSAESRAAIGGYQKSIYKDQLYDGTKALVTGEAGKALGERAVAITERQSRKEFTGTAADYATACRNIAGDLTGVNSIAEGTYGHDLATEEKLDGWERARRFSTGVGTAAGVAAGGISAGNRLATVPKRVTTPYGPAVQENSAAALRMRTQVQQGGTVYKGGALGSSETGASQFLATECPLNPGYASRYGIPPKNANFDFVITGRVRPGGKIITRRAPGIPPNPGGGFEVVTNPGDFLIDSFYMP